VRRLVQTNGVEPGFRKRYLQVTGTVTELQDGWPGEVGEDGFDPIVPLHEGNSPGDKVIGPGELVVEEAEEEAEEGSDYSRVGRLFIRGGHKWILT